MDDREKVALLAEMAGLSIDPAYLSGVSQNLELLLAQGALLFAAPVAAEIEPATVYRP